MPMSSENETVIEHMLRAATILMEGMDSPDLRRIQMADPYEDKRFVPVLARWKIKGVLGVLEEATKDLNAFKTLRARLKGLNIVRNSPAGRQ